jgi:CRP/FNR family transcriptional regulator, cyclic AMP receptor protein
LRSHLRSLLQPTAFGAVGDVALDAACSAARIEHFKVPTLLSAAGEQPAYLRLVVKGHIEVIARNSSGAEFAVGYITAGGWATWLACFMAQPPENDFYCSPSSTLVALPVAEVRALCERYPQIYPVIIRQIGRRMRLLLEWTGQSVLVGPVQRMAKLLHILAREQQVESGSLKLHVSQARLASLARCSRQTANTLLGVLEKKGLLVIGYSSVEIPELARLAAFADALGEDTVTTHSA